MVVQVDGRTLAGDYSQAIFGLTKLADGFSKRRADEQFLAQSKGAMSDGVLDADELIALHQKNPQAAQMLFSLDQQNRRDELFNIQQKNTAEFKQVSALLNMDENARRSSLLDRAEQKRRNGEDISWELELLNMDEDERTARLRNMQIDSADVDKLFKSGVIGMEGKEHDLKREKLILDQDKFALDRDKFNHDRLAAPKDFQAKVSALRGRADKYLSEMPKVSAAFKKLKSAPESAAGDISLVFNFMKMLDPGSTVREGEYATAQNATGVPIRVVNLYNQIISGERLSAGQRADFISTARSAYESQQAAADESLSTLFEQADYDGIPREKILGKEFLRKYEERQAGRSKDMAGSEVKKRLVYNPEAGRLE